MHLKDQKNRLLASIKERLDRFRQKERTVESRSLCKQILKLIPKQPTAICAYFPLPSEADTRPLLLALLHEEHPLFLPRIEDGRLAFRQVRSLDELTMDHYSLMEPPLSAPLLDPTTLVYAIIPGRAFDKQGNRLGRGNGGYDIWIKKQRELNPKTEFWGVAFDCQIVNEVPMEEHDQRMNKVITARGIVSEGASTV